MDRLLEETDSYKIEKAKVDTTVMEKLEVGKAMTTYLVDLRRSGKRLETVKLLLEKTSKEFLSSSSQKTTSGTRSTEMLLKIIPPWCLVFAYNVAKAILK